MRLATIGTLALIVITPLASAVGADVVTTTTFESVSLPAAGYINNSPSGFTLDGNFFNNTYDAQWGTWAGWAVSNRTDTTTAGHTNQFSAITGGGADGSSNYAVAFSGGSYINVADGQKVLSLDLTNTTYAYLSMLNGDAFAKKFGAGDFFTLSIVGHDGLNGSGGSTGEIDFNLADFTGTNHYIINTWTTVDLTSLGAARSLSFTLSSSDNGDWGMNTPAYFAIDDFRTYVESTAVPEPAGLALAVIGLAAVVAGPRPGRGRSAI